MINIMCNEQNHGLDATAHARVDVIAALANSTSWTFATKPYGGQRPTGPSPG